MTNATRTPAVSRRHAIVAGLLILLLVPLLGRASVPASPDKVAGSASPPLLEIRYQAGRLDLTARDARLADIGAALREATGMPLQIDTPVTGDMTVTVSLQDWPPDAALERLMAGLSYLQVDDGRTRRIIVLASGRQSGMGSDPMPRHAAPPMTISRPAGGSVAAPARAKTASDGISGSDGSEEDDTVAQASALLAELEPGEDGLIQAGMALEMLAASENPEAADALIRAVSPDSPLHNRVMAVDALWQHAAGQQFADPGVNAALERLATDRDESVRWAAAKAIRDMQAFRSDNWE